MNYFDNLSNDLIRLISKFLNPNYSKCILNNSKDFCSLKILVLDLIKFMINLTVNLEYLINLL